MSNIIKFLVFVVLLTVSVIIVATPVEAEPQINTEAAGYENIGYFYGDRELVRYGDTYCTLDYSNGANPEVDCFGLVSSFTNPEVDGWEVMYFDNGLICQGHGGLEECFFDDSNDI